MLRYLVLVFIYWKKKLQFISMVEEINANYELFADIINVDLDDMIKRQIKLSETNQGDKTPEQEAEQMQLEDDIERTQSIRRMKKKAEQEVDSADKVIEILRKKVLFKK